MTDKPITDVELAEMDAFGDLSDDEAHRLVLHAQAQAARIRELVVAARTLKRIIEHNNATGAMQPIDAELADLGPALVPFEKVK